MIDELAALGLDEKEARLYLAALELGESTVRKLADAAGVGRTNAYDILERLERRGLVSHLDEGTAGRRLILATDPQRLVERWEEQRRKLDSLVPSLRAMHQGSAVNARVRYYEGVEGILSVLYSTLRSSGPLAGILSMKDLLVVPGRAAMADYIAERVKQGLHLRVIRSQQKEVVPVWPTDPDELRELRYAPDDRVFTMTMFISDDSVAVLSSRRESFGMTIESAEYAELQRNMFEVLWGASTPM
jgi:HTH-type transcriptional regulator, sugar sensing transcriptional regulator